MKTLLIFILCFAINVKAQQKDFFVTKESEVYSLFNFMQTAAKMPTTSSTYRDFIDSKLSKNQDFQKLVKEFRSVDFNSGIVNKDYPDGRKSTRNYLDLIIPSALRADNLDDFNERITGIFPISEQVKIYQVLKKAQPYFLQTVWVDNKNKINHQIKELKKYNKESSRLFLKFNQFYKSSWDQQIPFYVTLYPIPGKSGSTTAVPHGNALCVGSITDLDDTLGTLGVTLHEMCHILYNEQSLDVQKEIDHYFKENKSKYSKLAYSYFNEAMATTLGNGYAYKILNKGILDKNDWYNEPTINRFAKVIYPITEKYLEENKAIDKNFVDHVIFEFEKAFPDSIYEYATNFNTVNIYTDQLDANYIFDDFFQYFNANNVGISSPLKNVSQSPKLITDDSSFIIILDQNQEDNFEELKKAFPEIREIDYKNTIQNISFIDSKARMIVILLLTKKEDLSSAFEKLEKHKKIDVSQLIQY